MIALQDLPSNFPKEVVLESIKFAPDCSLFMLRTVQGSCSPAGSTNGDST